MSKPEAILITACIVIVIFIGVYYLNRWYAQTAEYRGSYLLTENIDESLSVEVKRRRFLWFALVIFILGAVNFRSSILGWLVFLFMYSIEATESAIISKDGIFSTKGLWKTKKIIRIEEISAVSVIPSMVFLQKMYGQQLRSALRVSASGKPFIFLAGIPTVDAERVKEKILKFIVLNSGRDLNVIAGQDLPKRFLETKTARIILMALGLLMGVIFYLLGIHP